LETLGRERRESIILMPHRILSLLHGLGLLEREEGDRKRWYKAFQGVMS